MDSVFTGLASRHGSLAFVKIEAENPDVAAVSEALGVTVVPTFVAVSAGKFWGKIEGANPQGTEQSHFLSFCLNFNF